MAADDAPMVSSFAERTPVDAGYSYFNQPAAVASEQPPAAEAAAVDASAQISEGNAEGERPAREKRSRDRYGRERRDRNGGGRQRDGTEGATAAAPEAGLVSDISAAAQAAEFEQPDQAPTQSAQANSAPVVAVPAAPANAPVAPTATTGLPRVTPFELPLNELQRIAEGAGLEWINSDAQRVAQVQAAIAATPAVPRTPREPNRMVLPDEGPLVLVETRRDLKDMALPFDTTTSA